MELGLAVSIASLVDLTVRVIAKCQELVETAQHAPRELRAIYVEVSSLRTALENLTFLTENDSAFAEATTARGLAEVVSGCRTTLDQLHQELGSLSAPTATAANSESSGSRVRTAVLWTIRRSAIDRLHLQISQHKGTILVFLSSQTA